LPASLADGEPRAGLLVLALTDGCVTFDLTLLMPLGEGAAQSGLLESLLREISIERRPSSEVSGRPVEIGKSKPADATQREKREPQPYSVIVRRNHAAHRDVGQKKDRRESTTFPNRLLPPKLP
jgi:hypothetical protein